MPRLYTGCLAVGFVRPTSNGALQLTADGTVAHAKRPDVQSTTMTERRYGDEEVREILSLATTDGTRDRSLPAESGGLTLDELQRIGEEAGIEPARIAQAAKSLDARGKTAPVRRSFGLPIGMSRVVDLPRAPTDREWEQLISQFRTTFGTPGQSTTSGGLREWSGATCTSPSSRLRMANSSVSARSTTSPWSSTCLAS